MTKISLCTCIETATKHLKLVHIVKGNRIINERMEKRLQMSRVECTMNVECCNFLPDMDFTVRFQEALEQMQVTKKLFNKPDEEQLFNL